MILQESEFVPYLANILLVSYADGKMVTSEESTIEEVRKRIKANKTHLKEAKKLAETGSFQPTKVGSFGTQVSNLEDMLLMSLIDGEIAEKENSIINEFADQSGITQEQIKIMISEAEKRASTSAENITCPNCSASITKDSKFCPQCGAAIGEKSTPAAKKISFDVPKSGYAIEFSESTAASFADALNYAKKAENFDSCVRGKKTWYLASWSDTKFSQVIGLAEHLSGLKNKRIYLDGSELQWKEVFAFTWCSSERKSAYKPTEYCFGKDENRINPWGCKQFRMDWTEWANWFSYGSFKKSGLLRKVVWTFDKERISHEIKSKFHQYRYCPYIRRNLFESVIVALPDTVEVSKDSEWKFHQIYEEVPGSIKVVETENNEGYSYRNEYFSDGIRPKGLNAVKKVLTEAFKQTGVSDINISQLLK
tara:strand:- start:1498 stop:2766 length:1269 start_codon:yes stop_codon:yes gene_type:complete